MSTAETELRFLTLCEPKRGHSTEEYEDACAGNSALGRFAIADGATESSYAGLWARLLVDEFAQSFSGELGSWAAWLPALQGRWEFAVGQQPLPWYAEIKWQQGAFATFLGAVVRPPRWRALAVGDSCLFQIRAGRLHVAFPVSQAVDFTQSPWLVGSRGFTPEMMAIRELRLEGDWEPGDHLWMMTDALAQWFLQEVEIGQSPWELMEQWLAAPDAAAAFSAWVGDLRDTGQIRNDDVTVMSIWTGEL